MLRTRRNQLRDRMKAKDLPVTERTQIVEESKALKPQLAALENTLEKLDAELLEEMGQIPNETYEHTPVGGEASATVSLHDLGAVTVNENVFG